MEIRHDSQDSESGTANHRVSFVENIDGETKRLSRKKSHKSKKTILKKDFMSSKSDPLPEHQSRGIVYPKISLMLSLTVPRKISGYVSVKSTTSDKNSFTEVGQTEVIEGNETPCYKTPISIVYYVGISDYQKVIFEVFDGGDSSGVSDGYLLGVVESYVSDLVRSPTLPILRGTDILGYLQIQSTLECHTETANLTSSKFFKERPPTEAVVQLQNPSFKVPVVAYELKFTAKDFDPFNELEKRLIQEKTIALEVWSEHAYTVASNRASQGKQRKKWRMEKLWTSLELSKQSLNVFDLSDIVISNVEEKRLLGLEYIRRKPAGMNSRKSDNIENIQGNLIFRVVIMHKKSDPTIKSICKIPLKEIMEKVHEKSIIDDSFSLHEIKSGKHDSDNPFHQLIQLIPKHETELLENVHKELLSLKEKFGSNDSSNPMSGSGSSNPISNLVYRLFSQDSSGGGSFSEVDLNPERVIQRLGTSSDADEKASYHMRLKTESESPSHKTTGDEDPYTFFSDTRSRSSSATRGLDETESKKKRKNRKSNNGRLPDIIEGIERVYHIAASPDSHNRARHSAGRHSDHIHNLPHLFDELRSLVKMTPGDFKIRREFIVIKDDDKRRKSSKNSTIGRAAAMMRRSIAVVGMGILDANPSGRRRSSFMMAHSMRAKPVGVMASNSLSVLGSAISSGQNNQGLDLHTSKTPFNILVYEISEQYSPNRRSSHLRRRQSADDDLTSRRGSRVSLDNGDDANASDGRSEASSEPWADGASVISDDDAKNERRKKGTLELEVSALNVMVEDADGNHKTKMQEYWPGEDSYHQLLNLALKDKTGRWMKAMEPVFQHECDIHIDYTVKAMSILEAVQDGWNMINGVMLDMHGSCLTSLLRAKYGTHKEDGGISYLDEKRSNVYDLMNVVYECVSPFSRDRSIRVCAGGGVKPPPDSHPCAHYCRHIGFPLAQEILLASHHKTNSWLVRTFFPMWRSGSLIEEDADDLSTIFSASQSTDFPEKNSVVKSDIKTDNAKLLAKLNLGQIIDQTLIDPKGHLQNYLSLKGQSSWGGHHYVHSICYRNPQELRQGYLEAATIYHPCLVLPNIKSLLDQAVLLRSNSGPSKLQRSLELEQFWNRLEQDKFMSEIAGDFDKEALSHMLSSPTNDKDVKFVTWILGRCPPRDSLAKIERFMLDMARLSGGKVALLILLVAEKTEETVVTENYFLDKAAKVIYRGNPFKEFLMAFNSVYQRIWIRQERRRESLANNSKIVSSRRLTATTNTTGRSRRNVLFTESDKSLNDIPDLKINDLESTQQNPLITVSHQLLEVFSSDFHRYHTNNKRVKKLPRLFVEHRITWEEIVAQACVFEYHEDNNYPDLEKNLIPSFQSLRAVLDMYFPYSLVERMMRKDEIFQNQWTSSTSKQGFTGSANSSRSNNGENKKAYLTTKSSKQQIEIQDENRLTSESMKQLQDRFDSFSREWYQKRIQHYVQDFIYSNIYGVESEI